MKTHLPRFLLAGALASCTALSSRAQSADDPSAEVRQQQAQVARQAADAARQEAEVARQKIATARVEIEAATRQKAQIEVQRALEAAHKAIANIDLPDVGEAIRRAMTEKEAMLAKALFAQGIPPAPAVPIAPNAPPAPPAPRISPAKRVTGSFSGRRSSVRPLVVGTLSTDARTLAETEEDLSVMWRILDKETERELGKDGGDRALGIFISPTDSRGPNAVMLEGYGALFTLNVKFPLVALAKPKEEKKSEAPADSTWEKTKRELFGGGDAAELKDKFYRSDFHRSEVEYSAERVEALKNALLGALKNASNLRNLKADDWIAIAVQESSGLVGGSDVFVYKFDEPAKISYGVSASSSSSTTSGKTVTTSAGPIEVHTREPGASRNDGGRNSTLTIRVKKSDVDAFAGGKMTMEDFRQKAAINIY